MKKLSVIVLSLLFLLSSCGEKEEPADPNVVVIKEKVFIEQVNYIYLNAEKYLGKTIKYEGVFDILYDEDGNAQNYYVIRFGPGCCGNDGNAGFEVRYEGEYPAYDDWVEVEGVLCYYEADSLRYLYIEADVLNVLPERGNENVS